MSKTINLSEHKHKKIDDDKVKMHDEIIRKDCEKLIYELTNNSEDYLPVLRLIADIAMMSSVRRRLLKAGAAE